MKGIKLILSIFFAMTLILLISGCGKLVFYGSNSWAYTRLGHITNQDATSMAELLGNGDVTITVSK